MRQMKSIVAGALILGGLLTLAVPASAHWGHRRELRADRRELRDARRELRHDRRHGAGPAEIAADRARIARERREIWSDRHHWPYGYGDRYGVQRPWGWGWWR